MGLWWSFLPLQHVTSSWVASTHTWASFHQMPCAVGEAYVDTGGYINIKGTVSRDLLHAVFLIKTRLLAP
jgi:hypothetical protein